MIIACLDCETTGLDPDKGDKIIELSIVHWDSTSDRITYKYESRFNPERLIPESATAVHGIKDSDVLRAPLFSKCLPAIQEDLDMADMLVGHNVEFDFKFLYAEGVKVPKPFFDTAKNGRFATFNGKTPTLQELCFALGINYDITKAHAAEYDVLVTLECLKEGIRRGVWSL